MHRKPYNLDGIERIKVGGKNPLLATIKIAKKLRKVLMPSEFFLFIGLCRKDSRVKKSEFYWDLWCFRGVWAYIVV